MPLLLATPAGLNCGLLLGDSALHLSNFQFHIHDFFLQGFAGRPAHVVHAHRSSLNIFFLLFELPFPKFGLLF